MYSGSLDLFRLNPRPKIVKAKTSFKPNTHNFREISTTPTKNLPTTTQSPGHPHFCNIPAAGLEPRDLKRLLSLQQSSMGSHHVFLRIFPSPTVFATPKGHLLGHLVALDHPVTTNGKAKVTGFFADFGVLFATKRIANCEFAALGDLRLQSVPPTSLNSTSSLFLYPCLHRMFLRSFIMGNDAKTKINSSRFLKRYIGISDRLVTPFELQHHHASTEKRFF